MKKHIQLILLIIVNVIFLAGCKRISISKTTTINIPNGTITDNNNVDEIEGDKEKHDFKLISSKDNSYTYKCSDHGEAAVVTIAYISGSNNAFIVNENTIIFKNISSESIYSISGEFYGNIIIDITDDYKFELELNNFTQYSYDEVPIKILTADKVKISAKKETTNYIFDSREKLLENEILGSIYSESDLSIQGKGTLYVKSKNNNGISTKKDLEIKNLNLQVDCKDNALKGNDSVLIESGNIVLISRCGDGIKTTNTDISSKGKQRGTVTISGGSVLIYASCDGIDAAYNAIINEDIAAVSLQIFTDKYSKYSEEVTDVTDSIYYIKFSNIAYKYSLKYFNTDNDYIWVNSKDYTSNGNSYYYSLAKPSGYKYVQLFVYNKEQTQGQEDEYLWAFEAQVVNNNYDTLSLSYRNDVFKVSWTNYTTTQQGGNWFPGGPGMPGMDEGNKDKGDYSTKGIKSSNEILISGGSITINSYDDSLHADLDNTLENGSSSLGDVSISGGNLVLHSNDDAIHADNKTKISDGVITILSSYEGIEGKVVEIAGGTVSVRSTDDGINGTGLSGESIIISGGYLYVYTEGGDGIDSNSKSSYDGILFAGGKSVIISLGQANSSIDSEKGYKYTGGNVLAIGLSGGMSGESTKSSPSLSTIGKTSNLNLQKDSYITVSNLVTIKFPSSANVLALYLGNKDVTILTSSSSSAILDGNGVFWGVK